ncbi:hypothetical protein Taro_026803 [Colocasia esculenta]|uniref:Uncharacterized protein n=1 Tax=Colocasia esculenta TaxID=4460 RepID=A0A843VSE0_COLES|nr:hypothetical protein [Colocasia esculenta]
MQLSAFLFLSFIVLLVGVSPRAAAVAGSNGSATVYELLPKYGLPEGLLPDAVASYSLDEDGRFVVELARPSCYVQFDSYLVYYAQRITGTLKIGSIRDLEGIQVRRFFIWLDVDEIKVDLPPSDSIYFQVGWITRRLAVDEFHQVHSCLNQTDYRDRIKGLFPEPIYDIEELITGDVHVALQRRGVSDWTLATFSLLDELVISQTARPPQ